MVSSVALAEEDVPAVRFRATDGRPAFLIKTMFYTYIIESCSGQRKRYVGHTSDLKQRIADHIAGRCPSTAGFTPWKLKNYTAFETLEQAQSFERYLKSGSGHSFARRHFL
jgi:predicted GIY-YIG superfamily endonuclease